MGWRYKYSYGSCIDLLGSMWKNGFSLIPYEARDVESVRGIFFQGSNEVEPTDENAGVRQKSNSNASVPFAIFTDENQRQTTKEVTKPTRTREVLPAAVTSLPQASRGVLQPLELPKYDKSGKWHTFRTFLVFYCRVGAVMVSAVLTLI